MCQNIIEKEFIELLETKLSMLKEIFRLTNNIKLTGNINEAETFANLVDKREAIFSSIEKIDNEMLAERFNKINNISSNKYINTLTSDIKAIIKKIIVLIQEQSKIVPKIVDSIKNNLIQINNSKNVNSIYQQDIYVGNSFDIKQ